MATTHTSTEEQSAADFLASPEARSGAVILDGVIEERISHYLTREVLTALAVKGITESHARQFLRARVVRDLARVYS